MSDIRRHKEVDMEKIYECKNGTIYVTTPESCDREKLRRVTEDFLKKVINGGRKDGNSNTRKNIGKEQILYR